MIEFIIMILCLLMMGAFLAEPLSFSEDFDEDEELEWQKVFGQLPGPETELK